MDRFRRPFVAMRADPRWLTKLVLGALINLIPYVGTFVVLGWGLDYMRRVAWGSDESLPEWKDYGEHLKRGFLGFVVLLPYSLVVGIAAGVLAAIVLVIVSAVMSSVDVSDDINTIVAVFTFGSMFVISFGSAIAAMPPIYAALARYAIYDRIEAGFQFRETWSAMRTARAPLMRAWRYTAVTTVAMGTLTMLPIVVLVLVPMLLGAADVINEDAYGVGLMVYLALSPFLALALGLPAMMVMVAFHHWWGEFAAAAYVEPAGRPTS